MMESSVPLDTSNPAVRSYIALIRLQVLTPLSLLVNIATTVVCAAVISPNLAEINDLFRTTLSPTPWMIAMYGIAIWIGQIGYCMLLVLVRKPETKETIIHGSGQWLVWTNWVMAGWAIAFVTQSFLTATVLLGIALLLLIVANVALILVYPPHHKRPLDTAFIHAPVRFYLVLPLMILFSQNLFIASGWFWERGQPQRYSDHQWTAFGVVLGTNLLGLLIILFRRDIVWCAAATWLNASLFSARPKAFPVYITSLIFALVLPLTLVASYVFLRLRDPERLQREASPKRGPIALPPDPDVRAGPAPPQGGAAPASSAQEVDAEAIWG